MEENEVMVPTNDYVFKRIFGHKGNEEITKGLISAILKREIKEVDLSQSTILDKDIMSDKIGILDVKAVIDDGVVCDIEMQVTSIKDIEKRMLLYWTNMYRAGIKEGEKYKKLKKCICILIADCDIEKTKGIEKYHSKWQIREEEYRKGEMASRAKANIYKR